MTEAKTHHHDAHHTHDHAASPGRAPDVFPAAAENLLLQLARQATINGGGLPPGIRQDMLPDLDEYYGVSNICQRLGDAYPRLQPEQQAAVTLGFAAAYHSLSEGHARYDHAHHGHNHAGEDGCGKTHGPLRRALDTLEYAVVGRISNENARHLATAAFRGSALLFCPGDDLAAIGLQAYGAVAGNHNETHQHQEPNAILPRRPRIDHANGKAIISLPLVPTVRHHELPDTPQAHFVRAHTEDPIPHAPKERTLKPRPLPPAFLRGLSFKRRSLKLRPPVPFPIRTIKRRRLVRRTNQ